MFRETEVGIDDLDWAERSAYWAEHASAPTRKDRRKRPDRPLIILSGFGVRLFVDGGALIVQNGLTHYPQRREEWRFFSGDWRTPSRVIVLDGKGGLTFHALQWLAERDIQLVHIDWQGKVLHVVGGSGYAIDRRLAQAQQAAAKHGIGLELSRQLIADKINNSIATLRVAVPQSPATERALQRLVRDAKDVKRPGTIGTLLGIEGRAGLAYFNAWRSLPLRWKELGRRPIPDDWKRICRRSSYRSKKKNPNGRATHPVNAMLNYASAVLETQVRAHVIGAGLDPTTGFLHGSYPVGRTGLVYDLMEPLRPIVDRAVLQFVQKTTFSPFDFTMTPYGVCRLNPQLARSVVRMVDIGAEAGETVERVRRLL